MSAKGRGTRLPSLKGSALSCCAQCPLPSTPAAHDASAGGVDGRVTRPESPVMSAAGGRWAAWGGTTYDERTRERARDRRGEHLGGRAHLVDLDWVGSGCLEGREQQRQSGIRVDLVDGEAIKDGTRRAVLLAAWMDRGGCDLPGDERDVKVSAQEATTAGRELWWGGWGLGGTC